MATPKLPRFNRRAVSEWEGNYTGLIILMVMATAIIAYILMVSPAEREKFAIVPEKYTRTLLDAAPGLVKASAVELESKEFNFGSFSLDYSVQTTKNILKSQLTAKRSAFADSPVRIPISVPSNVEFATLEGLVSDRAGDGTLVVLLNGKEIFSEQLEINQKLNIELPQNLLQENVLEFAVSSPGLKFWQTNSYSLININLIISAYDAAKAVRKQTFTLTKEQASNLESAKLTGFVRRTSSKIANIRIKVNGKEVFSGTKEGSFEIAVPETYLKSGTNDVEFIVEKDGAYKFSFSKLTIDYTELPIAAKKYSFFVNDYNIGQIQQNNLDCVLKVVRESGGDSVNIKLNTNNLKLGFANGAVDENICSYLIAGDNTITLTADADISLSSLKVTVTAKQ